MATWSVLLLCFAAVSSVNCAGYHRRYPTVYENVCSLPKVVGPCEALVPSWFYNSTAKQCEFFNYGGCEGNGNRFSTKEACQRRCSSSRPEPCGSEYCNEGEMCLQQQAICSNPHAYCPTISRCVKGPGQMCECNNDYDCPHGEECKFRPIVCKKAPCPEGKRICLPRGGEVQYPEDPCHLVDCRPPPAPNCTQLPLKPGECCPEYDCPVNCALVLCAGPPAGGIDCKSISIPERCCPIWECQEEEPTCVGYDCPLGQVCELIQPHCFTTPCPKIPQCTEVQCSGPGQMCECSSDYDCPHGEECRARPIQCIRAPCPEGKRICLPRGEEPTCVGYECPAGQVCELIQPQCFTTPCPKIPHCTEVQCSGSGQMCECSSDYDCPQGEECKFRPVQCIRAPCPEGKRICLPREGEPTCVGHKCPVGQVCELIQPHCFTTPCPKMPQCREVQCSGPGQLCECSNDYDCPHGENCLFRPIQCVRAPCPEGRRICVPTRGGDDITFPEATCVGHKCPIGQVCELIILYCTSTSCVKVPHCTIKRCSGPGEQCDCSNDYDCPQGEECKSSPVECVGGPCPGGRNICLPKHKKEKPGLCPFPTHEVGICVFIPGVNCLSDENCDGQEKCCHEGCGRVCKYPIFPSPPTDMKG